MKFGNISQYVEVEPIIPTYRIDEDWITSITRIVKQLFSINPNEPNKIIIQDRYSLCMMIDEEEPSLFDFTTHPLHPDTMMDQDAAEVIDYCEEDKEYAESQLAMWGITKVYMDQDASKVISIHDFFDRLPNPTNGDQIGYNYVINLKTPERMKIFQQ